MGWGVAGGAGMLQVGDGGAAGRAGVAVANISNLGLH